MIVSVTWRIDVVKADSVLYKSKTEEQNLQLHFGARGRVADA